MTWMICTLALLAVVDGQRDSCKVECDRNFNRNSFAQVPALVPVCHRGCDMYVVAFISTSTNLKTDQPADRNSNNGTTHHLKNGNKEEANSINSVKKPISKTTAEPLLQPVQDRPAKAEEQTTTKLPNHDQYPKNIHKSIHSIGTADITAGGETKKNVDKENKQKMTQMRIEHAKRTCRHACIIAYGEVSQVEACVVGCHLQSKADHEQESEGAEKSVMSSLRSIESSMMNFVGHIGHFVRVSWSWTFPKAKTDDSNPIQEYGTQNSNNHQIVPLSLSGVNLKPAFSRDQLKRTNIMRPEVMHILKAFRNDLVLEPDLFEDIEQQMNDLTDNTHTSHYFKPEQPPKPHHGGEHKQDQKTHRVEIDHPMFHRGSADHHRQNDGHLKESFRPPHWMKSPEIRQSLDILECISRKSGLPRWFIAVTMFSSIPVALWLCFSLTAPPDETKTSKNKVVEVDDRLDYSDTADEKHKLIEDYDDCVKLKLETV